ncbi:pyrroline-5-carboxylate reductase [Defluviimonas sp. 20V17]|uniref:Pyrroline-5-carboxylate reductase n=1 Tax=Allgaiera indica TaxID=765699 RepID=A0AAN4UTZ0_9RHOB|nr:pyrroline-5-carboxylate reductase [Allgaiera indica]KDB05357.1 pyrroline-5-carboxylate reductase [Defluviimonas sp. 20V17]GHE04806.1 pyrroline-5-carboxylate reductase [Allgaiera indica]SDX54009.1 pyrroline-5-carboxylate reductase [Allgaiera indica]
MNGLELVAARGLVLLGCGKMGSAMLAGWLERGLAPGAVWVIDPRPSDWLQGLVGTGLHLNDELPKDPAIVLIAVKPQMMETALPALAPLGGGGTLFLSVAAGTTIAHYESVFGVDTPVIRAMPNTPAAIGRGITALTGNACASAADMDLAETLLSAVGQTVRLEGEHQMDAVTAVSGSGPAYVFHLIETLAAAGAAEGLPPDLAMTLARATVAGAGALAMEAAEDPAQLRVNVTSPGGTTAAALAVLMDEATGFPPLLKRAVKAAADRGRELGK